MNKSKSSLLFLAFIMLASAALGLLRFDSFQVGAQIDDAHYIVLAESLASGQGFQLVNFPNARNECCFPMGWPLLLSFIVSLFPDSFVAVKSLSFVLWLASIPLAYRLFASRLETPYLEIFVALVGINPWLVVASGMVMSEAAYLFFSLLALNLLNHQERDKRGIWLLVVGVGAAIWAMSIRTVGISLLLTVILYLMVSRRFREMAVAFAIVALGILPQFWQNVQSGGSLISSGYQSMVFGSPPLIKLAGMWENARAYTSGMISHMLVPVFGPNIATAFSQFGLEFVPALLNVLILLLLALGGILALRRPRTGDLYATIYFVGILAFEEPSLQSAQYRFLLPLLPFLYFYLLLAMKGLVHRIPNLNSGHAPAVLVGLSSVILLFSIVRNIADWRNPIRNRMNDLTIGAEWIRANTRAESVVMVNDPVPDYLYLRRRTVEYPGPAQDIEEMVAIRDVDYIKVAPKLGALKGNEPDDSAKSHLHALLKADPNKYRLVWSDPANGVWIYQVCDG